MNYCSLDLSNPKVIEISNSLSLIPTKDSLIKLIRGSVGEDGEYIDGLLDDGYQEHGEFHPFSKQDIIVLLNKLKADANKKISEKEIQEVITDYNSIFGTASSKVIDGCILKEGNVIDIFGAALNTAVSKDLTSDGSSLLSYNAETNTIPIGGTGLNRAIKAYKNKLFRILVDYCGPSRLNNYEELYLNDLYDVNGDQIILEDQYSDLLNAAWNKIQEELSKESNGIFNENVDVDVRRNILNPVKALYVLNDFDNFITKYSHGQIVINKLLIDKLAVFDKYTIKEKALRLAVYNNDTKSSDAENELSGLFFMFFQNIPDGLNGTLTKHDFLLIRKTIENLKSDLNSTVILDILKENPTLNGILLFLELMKDGTVISKIGKDICKNVGTYFSLFLQDYNKQFNSNLTNNEEKKLLEHDYNYCDQMLYEMLISRNTAYQCKTEDGSKIETATKVTKSKNVLNQDLKAHIKEAFENGDYYLFDPKYIIPTTSTEISEFTDVFSDRYVEYVRKLTGVDLNSQYILDKVSTPEGAYKLAKYIVAINNSVKTKLYPYRNASKSVFDTLLDTVINDLKKNSSDYIGFTTLLTNDNLNNQQLLRGQNLEQLPSVSVANTITKFSENWSEYQLMFGEDNENLFNQFDGIATVDVDQWGEMNGYTDRIVFRHDYSIGTKKYRKYIAAKKLVSDESATVALNWDFIDSMLNSRMFLNQIECVSDKTKIPLGCFNANGKLKGSNVTLFNADYNTLLNCFKKQHNSYYQKIELNIVSDFRKIFNDDTLNLDEAIKKLEGLTYNQLYDYLYKYNESHPNDKVQLTDQLHYDWDEESKLMRFNASLYLSIKAAYDDDILETLLNNGFDDFIKFIDEKNVPVLFDVNNDPRFDPKTHINDYRNLVGNAVHDTLGNNLITEKAIREVFAYGTKWTKWDTVTENGKQKKVLNTISEAFLKKFFILQQLCTEADLQITVKDPIIHSGKNCKYTLSQLQEINTSNLNSHEALFEELSSRIVKGKKRNNALVASYLQMMQRLKYGVADTMNIAFITSPVTSLVNYNGDRKSGQERHDGGGLTNPIFNQWELHSYLGRKFHDTKKAIGLFINAGSFTQIKYADFNMSNDVIRNSFIGDKFSDDKYDCLELMRKMNNYSAEALRTKYNSTADDQKVVFDTNLYVRIDGEIYQIQQLDFNNYQTIWKSITNPDITKSISMLDGDNGFTVFGLWQSLGGAHSMSVNENGNLDYSEASNVYTADLISVYAPELKSVITAKLIDATCAKSGITNANPKEKLLSSPRFMHFVANTSRMGIQQDYYHDADESLIPSLTQVLTAIAFNGQNIDLVNEVYNALSDILDESLRPLKKLFNDDNKHGFNKYVAQKLLKSLLTSGVQSNAVSIVQDTLEQIYKDKTGEISVPYSSRQIFAKVTSDFIANLNKDSLRLKFAGIAIVQNPSQGLVGIYEDKKGIRYTNTDLEKLAFELGYTGPNENAVQFALQNYEGFKIDAQDFINIEQLSIGDNYKLTLDENAEVFPIKDPEDFLKLRKNGITHVYRAYNVQRDLRACNISFTDNKGNHENLWTLESTRLKILDKNNKFNILFYRANLKGLGEDIPYYFRTKEDFLLYLKAKSVEEKESYKTKILKDTLIYKPGEQIIPNVNKSIQQISDNVSLILREGEKYFAKKVKQDLTKVSNIIRENKDEFTITLTNDKKEIVYTTSKPTENAVLTNGYSEGELIWIYDSIGNKVVRIPTKQVFVEEYNKDGKQVCVVYLDANINSDVIDENNEYLTLYEELENIIKSSDDTQAYYFQGNLDLSEQNKLNKLINYLNDFDLRNLPKTIENQSKKLFESFKLSLKTISARIPSQSFQSFMANETVAFMEGDGNDGYVNLWQIWFQGSDFDIDKAYTMMFELDKHGVIATTSNLSQYDSDDAIKESLTLPKPDASLVIDYDNFERYYVGKEFATPISVHGQLTNAYKELPKDLSKDVQGSDPNIFKRLIINYNIDMSYQIDGQILYDYSWKTLSDKVELLDGVTKIKFYKDLLNALKIYGEGKNLVFVLEYFGNDVDSNGYLTFDNIDVYDQYQNIKLFKDLNKHNSRTKINSSGLKNKVMYGVYSIATDIHNLESAIQPMEMKPVTKVIDYYEKEYKPDVAFKKYSYWSPTPKWMILYENSVGKEDVGIAANAIKATGAIQQRFNMIFKQNTIVPETAKLKLDLNFEVITKDKDGKITQRRQICRRNFVKWANTVCTEDQFYQLCEGKDFTNDTDYLIIKQYLNDTKLVDVDKKVSDDIIADWKLYTEIYGNKTLDDYVNFLWFRTNFENNAADYESIFISMATDNAKELALARLHATPELMSMPLALVGLGMDINLVVDICVNLLDIVAKDLEANRFVLKTASQRKDDSNDIRSIIQKHSGEEFTKETADSLLAAYNLAQEMRTITSFFKVNQGITANYSDLLKWLDGLSRSKLERDEFINSELSRINDPDRRNAEITRIFGSVDLYNKFNGYKIDFSKLFSNEKNYADDLQAYCEAIKVGVNYVDVIRTSPHFRAQLMGTDFITKLIENSSFVASLAKLALSDVDPTQDDEMYSRNETEEASQNEGEEKPKHNDFGKKNASNLYKRMNQIGYHYAAGIALERFSNGYFNYDTLFKFADLDSAFENKMQNKLGMNVIFDLSTNQGMLYYVDLIHNSVIPFLKKTYKDNLFVRSLEKQIDYDSGRTIYGCKFDVFGNIEDFAEAEKLNQARVEFSNIMRNDSKIKTLSGNLLSIGEALYLYSLITTKDSICALNTILREITSYSIMPNVLVDVNKDLDLKVQKGQFNEILSNIGGIDRLNRYKHVLSSNDKSADGINMADGYILTKLPIKSPMSYQEFKQQIENQFKSKAIITLVNESFKDGILSFTYRLEQNGRTQNIINSISNIDAININNIMLDVSDVESITKNISDKLNTVYDYVLQFENDEKSEVVTFNEFKNKFKDNNLLSSILDKIDGDNITFIIKKSTAPRYGINRSYFATYNVSDIDHPLTYVFLRESSLSVNNEELLDILMLILTNSNDYKTKVNTLLKFLTKEYTDLLPAYERYLKDLEEDPEYKRECILAINQFTKALERPDLYYHVFPKLVNDYDAKIGDIYVVQDKDYLCLGKKRANKYTFVELHATEKPNVIEQKHVVGQKKAELKLYQNYSLVAPKKPDISKYSEPRRTDINEVIIGDIIHDFNNTYTVAQILYEGDKKLLIGYNHESKEYLLFDNHLLNISKKPRALYIEDDAQKAKSVIDGDAIKFVDGFKYLRTGDRIISKDSKRYEFVQALTPKSILVRNNEGVTKLDIQDIKRLDLYHTEVFDKLLRLVGGIQLNTDDKGNIEPIRDEAGNFKRNWSEYSRIFINENYTPRVGDIIVLKEGASEKLYKSIGSEGDLIFFVESVGIHNDIFNIVSMSKDAAKKLYMSTMNLVYTKSYAEKTTNFTWNMDAISDSEAKKTDTQKGLDILEKLSDQFGVGFLTIKEKSADFIAKLEGEDIVINIAKKPRSMTIGEFIAKQALHEFSHLALANLQTHSPEAYFYLIESVKKMLLSPQFKDIHNIWSNILYNSKYDSLTEKVEEYIVKYVETVSSFDENTDFDKFILTLMNQAFGSLFGIGNLNESIKNWAIGSLLSKVRSDFFGETLKTFNMKMIQNESVALKMFDKIEIKC